MKYIHNIEQVDRQAWSKFVKSHPYSSIFQMPEMADVYKKSPHHEPILIAAYDDKNSLCGILLGVIITHVGAIKFLSSRSIIYRGPIVKNNDKVIAKELLSIYTNLVKYHCVYTEIRNNDYISSFRSSFESLGYNFLEHLNIRIDLERSIDQVWRDMYSKQRRIRKAIENGYSVQRIETKEEYDIAYKVIKERYLELAIPLADKAFFDAAYEVLFDKGLLVPFKVIGADNKMVGTMLILNFNGVAYDWYAAGLSQYHPYCINDLMPWGVIKEMHSKGCTTYDWGGAGNPNEKYGVRQYKKKFGGTMSSPGRYLLIHKKFTYTVVSWIYQKTRNLAKKTR